MLFIDVGNSRIKWAVLGDAKALSEMRAFEYAGHNLQSRLDQFMLQLSAQEVFVSCVAGSVIEQILQKWFMQNWQIEIAFAKVTKKAFGVTNAYSKVEALGVDRWLVILSAFNRYRQAVCIIDCGTAVTVDVVDAKGMHLGGLIMPGLALMRASLSQQTSAIENNRGDKVLLATDTASAVEGGCHLMLQEALNGVFKKLKNEVSGDLKCIVTGGDGEVFAKYFKGYVYQQDLVLCGLQLLAGKLK